MAKSPDLSPAARLGRQARSSSARLAAVQALYSLDVGETDVETLVRAFMDGSLGGFAMVDTPDPDGIFEPTETRADLEPLEGELFCTLVRGAQAEMDRLDDVIRPTLSSEWPWERLEPVVRAVLRAGVYELLERPRTPPRVAIKEYVDIAAAFYTGAEKGLVNAVLDKVARSARPDAFGGGA
ncbi:transcription antitermination factor NusB [Pararhodospirillum oryzae]|uniref:Transcription antitermination protein NusB n=1 Tax=Pararhodospirillum oryzae TaxID=478448 RepID=A0A512HAJ9_9PROT|nr:transcription antitermination factor NusB [Pararhodospirillum oryzae]GEO82476.1 N utilization substance protein B [Pararhodospirillum oryzae]